MKTLDIQQAGRRGTYRLTIYHPYAVCEIPSTAILELVEWAGHHKDELMQEAEEEQEEKALGKSEVREQARSKLEMFRFQRNGSES